VDIKSLSVFVKIVQLQSFTRTAEEMCVTQPTISKTIHHLEQEIGVALFQGNWCGFIS